MLLCTRGCEKNGINVVGYHKAPPLFKWLKLHASLVPGWFNDGMEVAYTVKNASASLLYQVRWCVLSVDLIIVHLKNIMQKFVLSGNQA